MAQHFESVEEYISSFPPEVQTVLQTARKTIRAAAPGAQESISYAIPTFSVDGRPVVYLAGWKKHISIYPIPELDENLELHLVPWKGTVKIPLEKPIPYELITVLVERLVTQRH
jgi:uncharacterized protein YdhG (YjbR/CyaY superfamily)